MRAMRGILALMVLLPVLVVASRGNPTRSSASHAAEEEHIRKLIVGGEVANIDDCACPLPFRPRLGAASIRLNFSRAYRPVGGLAALPVHIRRCLLLRYPRTSLVPL